MRILMLSDVFFPRVNGVSTSIQTYRTDLLALGHECLLVAPEYPGADHSSDVEPMQRIPSRQVPRDPEDRLFKWRALMDWADRLQPEDVDVVHIQTPFVAHYAGVKIARRLGAPVVETYHTYFEHYLHHYVPALPTSLMQYMARRFTVSQCHDVQAVISPSRQMADALRAYGVRTPIEVLPTGLPPGCFAHGNGSRFRADHGIAAQRPMALFVGRVAHEKNIDFLIRMLEALRVRVPDVLLVIAGEGPAQSHIRQLVAEAGLSEHVKFMGYMDRATTLLDCYRAADVFVFASRTETQGLVLLEALAQGTPVVSTAVMGTMDVLQGVQGGIVVPEDVDLFADATARVLRDPALRETLSAHAREDAARWSSKVMAERLLRLYEGVIEADLSRDRVLSS
ncbi:MAG: glycosyltransferase family 4 protein [Gammaproteobacteria bacterium]|jgi:1,2-diacylglycerol 3-alpha-glucosyltransferase|nr:glycosyltransferase family 4 protein [Gammaproteobacteria bacterium]